MNYRTVDPKKTEALIHTLFLHNGFSDENASLVAKALMETSLRGVDSHGIRLVPHYIEAIKHGRINTKPNIQYEWTSGSTLKVNADHGMGHVVGLKTIKEMVQRAKTEGVVSASVRESTHFGAAAIYGLELARNNLIGLSFTHADALVVPHNGKVPLFGTNPICFTAPAVGDDIFCLDMSTSQVAYNKIITYREDGKSLTQGWAVNKAGEDTTTAQEACYLKPAGLYKGQGLGMMVEILCALLAGAPFDHEINRMFDSPKSEKRHLGHFFMAIDIERFQNLEAFKQRLSTLMNFVRSQSSVSSEPVMASGDPEKEMMQKRLLEGIPMKEMDYERFLTLAAEVDFKW